MSTLEMNAVKAEMTDTKSPDAKDRVIRMKAELADKSYYLLEEKNVEKVGFQPGKIFKVSFFKFLETVDDVQGGFMDVLNPKTKDIFEECDISWYPSNRSEEALAGFYFRLPSGHDYKWGNTYTFTQCLELLEREPETDENIA